jgi:hypothetical protein
VPALGDQDGKSENAKDEADGADHLPAIEEIYACPLPGTPGIPSVHRWPFLPAMWEGILFSACIGQLSNRTAWRLAQKGKNLDIAADSGQTR